MGAVLAGGVASMLRRVAAFLSLALLVACGRDQEAPTSPATASKVDTPVAAVRSLHTALRNNDLPGFLHAALPPSEVAKLRADWDRVRVGMRFTEEQRAQFTQAMSTLTQEGAVDAVMTLLEPQLRQLDQQLAHLPMAIMMGSGFAIGMIQQDERLSPEQKEQARQVLEAATQWAVKMPFNDRARIRKAVEAAVATANRLEVSDLEQLKQMSFEELLAKGGIVLAGMKQMFEAFDFSIDQALDSLQVELIAERGDEATVRTKMIMFGVPIVSEGVLVRREGGWYGRDVLEQLAAARQPVEPQASE